MEPALKIVVVYDPGRNEYFILAHNQTTEEAQRLVELNTPLVKDCSLIVLDQTRRHRTADSHLCRACRETVTRSSHLSPHPKYKRRIKL
jgi:hypothetical protein